MAARRPLVATESGSGRKIAPEASSVAKRGLWQLWLPARLGPVRKKRVRMGSITVTRMERKMELPPGPNDRLNWHTKARWIAEWRKAAHNVARYEHQIPPLGRIRISAILCRTRLGTADEDNDRARLKPLVDGLRDAGVMPNDTRGFVAWGAVIEDHPSTLGPGVWLILEPLAGTDDDGREEGQE